MSINKTTSIYNASVYTYFELMHARVFFSRPSLASMRFHGSGCFAVKHHPLKNLAGGVVDLQLSSCVVSSPDKAASPVFWGSQYICGAGISKKQPRTFVLSYVALTEINFLC